MSVVDFGGLELATSPGHVMTPRTTSLALVELALDHIGNECAAVVDVGTGSGAIAIAIAEGAPRARVWATDVSADAVRLARANSLRCGVADRVHVRCGHLLDPLDGVFDVIVANLPYLGWHERSLHPELASEPPDALFALGDGLGHYRCLLAAASARLSPDGLIAVQFRGRVLAAAAVEIEDLNETLSEQAA